jgi:hypothetical protein
MCIVSHDVILEVAKGDSDFVISTDRTADYPTIFVQPDVSSDRTTAILLPT